jgi:hypothetical protein
MYGIEVFASTLETAVFKHSRGLLFAAKIVTETVIVPSTTPSLPLPFSFVTFFEDF